MRVILLLLITVVEAFKLSQISETQLSFLSAIFISRIQPYPNPVITGLMIKGTCSVKKELDEFLIHTNYTNIAKNNMINFANDFMEDLKMEITNSDFYMYD
jgi:hypothetical protein